MVEDDGEDGDAAQSVEGGNEGGQPFGALVGEGSRAGLSAGFARCEYCRSH